MSSPEELSHSHCHSISERTQFRKRLQEIGIKRVRLLIMMKLVAFVVLIGVLARGPVGSLANLAALPMRSVDDYLRFMEAESSDAYLGELEWVSQHLNEQQSSLDLNDPTSLLAALRKTRSLVEEAIPQGKPIDHPEYRLLHLKNVLDELANLAEPVESWEKDCKVIKSMYHFLDSINSVFGGVHHFNELMHEETGKLREHEHGVLLAYLKHFGFQHLSLCLKELIHEYDTEAEVAKWDHEIELDQLLTPSADPSQGSDEHLLEVASEYDFTSEDFDELMTLKAIERSALGSAFSGDYSTTHNAMSNICGNLKLDLGDLLITYDLAKALIPDTASESVSKEGVRFFKLDEYFRLCNEWKSRY